MTSKGPLFFVVVPCFWELILKVVFIFSWSCVQIYISLSTTVNLDMLVKLFSLFWWQLQSTRFLRWQTENQWPCLHFYCMIEMHSFQFISLRPECNISCAISITCWIPTAHFNRRPWSASTFLCSIFLRYVRNYNTNYILNCEVHYERRNNLQHKFIHYKPTQLRRDNSVEPLILENNV